VHELRPHQIERKYQAIRCYRTQTQYIEDHLLSYVRRNELFDLSPDPSPTRGWGFPLRGLGVFQDR
jgi:hypothetical protein